MFVQGVIVKDFRLIVRNYLTTWFLPDFVG